MFMNIYTYIFMYNKGNHLPSDRHATFLQKVKILIKRPIMAGKRVLSRGVPTLRVTSSSKGLMAA